MAEDDSSIEPEELPPFDSPWEVAGEVFGVLVAGERSLTDEELDQAHAAFDVICGAVLVQMGVTLDEVVTMLDRPHSHDVVLTGETLSISMSFVGDDGEPLVVPLGVVAG